VKEPASEAASAAPLRGDGISVVIVSYNVREILDACLQSLKHAAAHFDGTVEIIVFDNASRDATVSLLKPRWPDVTWIASDRNLGFGTGCNRGAAVATQELLLFLNPDTLVSEDTLRVMRDFFLANPAAGVAGCKIVNRDGSLQAASKRSFPSPRVAAYKFVGLGSLFPKSRVFGRYNLTYLDENQTHEVDAVSGSFLCIPAALYAQVGGFDEDFFMYGEDLDLCFRVKLAGRINYYHPATRVIHFKGESAKSRPFLSFLYFHEAMIIFSRKHLELRTLPSALLTIGVALLALVNFASSRFLKWPRWLADLLVVNGVLALATFVYQDTMGGPLLFHRAPRLYFLWHLLVSSSALLPLAYIGEYGRRIARPRAILVATGIGFLIFFSLSFFMHERAFSRIVFGLTALVSIFLLTGWRWVTNHGGKLFRRIMAGSKRVAILGTCPRALALAELIQNESLEGYECVGFIPFPSGPVPASVRANVIGDLDSLSSLTRKLELQGVILVVDDGMYPAALQILAKHRSTSFEVQMLLGSPEPGRVSLINLNFTK
jgi:GT2 family glycosyltransferase